MKFSIKRVDVLGQRLSEDRKKSTELFEIFSNSIHPIKHHL